MTCTNCDQVRPIQVSSRGVCSTCASITASEADRALTGGTWAPDRRGVLRWIADEVAA